MWRLAALLVFLEGCQQGMAFYIPGVNPCSFREGDPVKMKVNKVTSSKTLMPIEYYKLPFCKPKYGPRMDRQNLGQFLAGDRINDSPYRLKMKTDMFCEQVCVTNVGRPETIGVRSSRIVRAIRKGYHNNWILDNLPSAGKVEDDTSITTNYWQGFPIGFVDPSTKRAYINNHVNIEIMYHPVAIEENLYRVVRFTVQPFSIKHEFEYIDIDDDDRMNGDPDFINVAKITNPIRSCKYKEEHTTYNMIHQTGQEPQPASGKVLFTYDVTWVENGDLRWASRWDIYLSMDYAIPAKVHWLGIANSLMVVFFLSAMIAAILVRNIRCGSAHYSHLVVDEEKHENLKQESGQMKLLHMGAVFGPPSFSPLMLAVACGTGAQILCASFLTIILAMMGFLNPARRGSLLTIGLLLFVMMGGVAGYGTARLYKTFGGENWKRAAALVAVGFPGVVFGCFLLMDLLAYIQESSAVLPFLVILSLLGLWFGLLMPLVFLGAHFGNKHGTITFPTSNDPDEPTGGIPSSLALGGILPFGACFVELRFILASMWMGQYYFVFGFLLLVFLLLIVICAEVAILFCHFQLSHQNYDWWWCSFFTTGSTALYVFFYSFVYYHMELEADSFVAGILYFGYMALACFSLFLMTGFVGVASCLWFNRKIHASTKE